MKIELLLSTMHQNDRCIIDRLGLQSDAVIVNQCDCDSVDIFDYNGYKITWINSTQRGLSRSRNMAISNSTADICVLVDDDEILVPGYAQIIVAAFERHQDASIIGFQVEGIESIFKQYSSKESPVGYIKSMRMASVEIAFLRRALVDNDIRFNEAIGAGTKYKMGEENAVLFNGLDKGLKIYYAPYLIGQIHLGNSTWFNGFDDDYFHARGAVFTAMSSKWSLLLIYQFAIRKYSLYRKEMDFFKALKLMINGRNEYLNSIKTL